jgi:hypothetical protein
LEPADCGTGLIEFIDEELNIRLARVHPLTL